MNKFPLGLMKVFMSAEQRRFFSEGFPAEVDDKRGVIPSDQE